MASLVRSAPLSLMSGLFALLATVAASACADTADGPLVTEEPVPEEVVTTTTAAPEPPRSEGIVEIGDIQYEFTVTCQDRGAGEVVVIGVGDDPASDGGLAQLFVQASLVEPYVGLTLADGTEIEVSLDSPLDFYVQNDVIRASAIRFVKDLNPETFEATDMGFGEFEIHCYSYEREQPS